MLTRIPWSSGRWIRQGFMIMVVAIATILTSQFTTALPSPFNALPAQAQSGHYPVARNPYINDYAKLLTPEDAASIQQSFSDLERQHGIEAVVVTINSIQEYGTDDRTIESFATSLFNTWGIGDAEKNNGILVLMSVGDRKVRIEVGSGYGTALDSAMKTIIDEYMVPRFRQNNYSGGLRRGTEAVIQRVTTPETVTQQTPQAAYDSPDNPQTTTYSQPNESGGNLWLLGGGIGGAGVAGFGLKTYLRYRHRRCSSCGTAMVRLDEHADDQFLDAGQKTEEWIDSVEYDVWQCPSCQQHDINRYSNPFSKYAKCKGCGYKTMHSSRQTIESATYTSSGTAEVTQTCKQCSYRNTYTVTIPKKEKPSSSSSSSRSSSSHSSSSSSGGGGRSSGGGASGSW